MIQLLLAATLALTSIHLPEPGVNGSGGRPTAPDPELLVVTSTGLEGLLVDARDAGLARALAMLDERLLELERDLPGQPLPRGAVELAHDLLTGPFCLRVELADPADPRSLRAQLTARGRSPEHAADLARRVTEWLPPGRDGRPLRTPLGPLTVVSAGDTLVVALGEGRAEDFAAPRAALPPDVEPAFAARWNGRGIGALLRPMFAARGSEGARAWTVIEQLGLAGETAPTHTFALGFAADRAVWSSVASGWTAALGDEASQAVAPLDADDYRRVPPDATFARLGAVQPRRLLALLDAIEPGTSAQAVRGVQAATGVDLGELLGLLGPTAGAFASVRTGGGGLASGVAFVETRDAARLSTLMGQLAGVVNAVGQGPGQGRVALRPWEHAGAHGWTLAFPGLPVPLELTLAVHGDALWVALRPDALAQALAEREGSLLDHPRLADVAPPADAVSFAFLDAPWFLERGYGTACAVSSGAANALRSPYDTAREPGSLLPSLSALLDGARPSVAWSRVQGRDLIASGSADRSWTATATAALGTPLARVQSAAMALGVVSSVAIPKLMTARLAANEAAAVATMRTLVSAQAQLQATAAIDEDGDGVGEYGFLGELSGVRPLRGQRQRLRPPVLSASFGALQGDGSGEGVVQRSGYFFKVFLPGADRAAVAEWPGPGDGPRILTEAAEQGWCAYAWPVQPGQTGLRAFYVDQDGDVLQHANPGGQFGGLSGQGGRQPDPDAAQRLRGWAPVH